jgi:hypothetical protein
MASGHVNRTERPNTWLHRPTCVREESPCQSGAVHTWQILLQNYFSHPRAQNDSRLVADKEY